MKRIHIVPKDLLNIYPGDDLATVRTKLQRWVDNSVMNLLPLDKAYNKPISRIAYNTKVKVKTVGDTDTHYAEQTLRERFRRIVKFKIKSPHRVEAYISCSYDVTKFLRDLSEILDNRFLTVRLYTARNFLLFRRVTLTISPSIVEFDLDSYRINSLNSHVVRNAFVSYDYFARSYVAILNERTGIVSIVEKNIRRRLEDIDSSWMLS